MAWGLEAAIHLSRLVIEHHKSNPDMCLLKLDFSNAFNQCSRERFLERINRDFPEILGWVQFCYGTQAELRFGNGRILSSSGVQQGDPLGPLLFSLVLAEMLDSLNTPLDLDLQIWYLDDGTIIGPRSSVARLFNEISDRGPDFGLFLNRRKCELFWPGGDQTFPLDCARLTEGVGLLGSPLWGSEPSSRAR